MKKIICLMLVCFLYKNISASPWWVLSYINHTQNTSYVAPMGTGAIIVPVNIGDSISLTLNQDCWYVGTWFFNGDTMPGSSLMTTLNTVVTQPGNFMADGCNGNFLFCLNSFPGPIYGLSYNNYTQNNSDSSQNPYLYISAHTGDSLHLHVWMNCGFGIVPPYNWYFNGILILNTVDSCDMTVIITQSGVYSARIHNCLFGGFSDLNFVINNITGVATIKNIDFLNVFPTAVNSSIAIQLNSIKPNDVEISFYDINGKPLKNDFYKNISGEFIKNENTEALAKGIYFIRIKAGNEVVNKKFIKM